MKNQVFVVVAVASLSVSAHQLSNEKGHNTSWDWNGPSHTHSAVSKPAPTPVPAAPKSTIQGLKGLDRIAKVGECYVPAYVEARCENDTKKVLVQAAYEETQVVPAVTKQVVRKVMVSPARTIEEYVPALYESVTKRVLVEEAHSEWRKGNSTSIQKIIDGDTYCLVQVPARYETKTNKVLRIPASTKTKQVDAVFKDYKETVIVTPETTRVVKSHPAVYKTVQECVEKVAGRYEWRSILCEQNATTSVLRSFEKALSDQGHLLSANADGIIDGKTTSAIKAYQKSKGLPVDGLVNIETVKSLGVKY